MINWKTASELPIELKEIIGISSENLLIYGLISDGKLTASVEGSGLGSVDFTTSIKSWCYKDELLATIPKEKQ